jgi:hypothetical protein
VGIASYDAPISRHGVPPAAPEEPQSGDVRRAGEPDGELPVRRFVEEEGDVEAGSGLALIRDAAGPEAEDLVDEEVPREFICEALE